MPCNIRNNSSYDISGFEPLVQDLYDYASQKFAIKQAPRISFVSDDKNHPYLGNTGQYDPSTSEIIIYVDGRHPKDMMRSIAHELVHHHQNENGMFDNTAETYPGYAQNDNHLRKMEKQAYLQGNLCFRDWEDNYKSQHQDIFYEGRVYKMSTNNWKNKELNTLLAEQWGFSMNLDKINEEREITHMCALEVTHKASGKVGHPIQHTLTESGDITHYTVEFDDVIVENISVENLDIIQQKEHMHKRDDVKPHDQNKQKISEEDLEMVDCGDKGRVPKYACDGKGANDLAEADDTPPSERKPSPEFLAILDQLEKEYEEKKARAKAEYQKKQQNKSE